MARLKRWGERIDRQTRYWGMACVVMASMVLLLAPPPIFGLCPDPENPCAGSCCNGACCTGSCFTKSDGTKICCPAGQVLCNDACCAGQCLTKSDGSKICCPAGQMLCNDACCAGPVCCNNETCGFNCSTTGGPNDTCKVCPDATGAPNKMCKTCPDLSGAPNKNCFQCDTDNNGIDDACWSCRTSAGGPLNNCGIDTDGNGTKDCCMRFVPDYAALMNCPTVKPNPYYTPSTNGCSSPLGNDPCGLGFTSFLACCNAHDIAYGTCNTTKAAADTAFLNCMLAVCGPANPSCGWTSCNFWANTYYNAVWGAGGSAYESAQYDACYCCYGTG